MKNHLFITLDTSSVERIKIGKSEMPPVTFEELSKVVLLDIDTLCEALVITIRAAHQMGIKTEGELMKDAVDYIHTKFVDSGMSVETPVTDLFPS